MAALLVLPSGPSAASWLQLGRSVEATVFYDKETIRKSATGVKMWTLTNFSSVEVIEGKSHRSAKTRVEYDCTGEKYRVLATIFYELPNGTGKVTASTSLVEQWNPVAPKTMAEDLLKVACAP